MAEFKLHYLLTKVCPFAIVTVETLSRSSLHKARPHDNGNMSRLAYFEAGSVESPATMQLRDYAMIHEWLKRARLPSNGMGVRSYK